MESVEHKKKAFLSGEFFWIDCIMEKCQYWPKTKELLANGTVLNVVSITDYSFTCQVTILGQKFQPTIFFNRLNFD